MRWPLGREADQPAVYSLGAVSLTASASATSMPVTIPGIAGLRMILRSVQLAGSPSASAPSRYDVGTWESADSVALVMYGMLITGNTNTPAARENPQSKYTTSAR